MKTNTLSIVLALTVILMPWRASGLGPGADEIGPYTVEKIDRNIWHIMDCNSQRPAGAFTDGEGKPGYNNISDMYLIVGGSKALLIDLSNRIDWADNAEESLRKVIASRIGKRGLLIAITHNHGDHTGMVGAFASDPEVRFLLPADDFIGARGAAAFPAERTAYFGDGYRIDLGGGVSLSATTVAGHTRGSTVFFLDGRNICFSGDAIGSGSGVWIFDYQSLVAYSEAVPRLLEHIGNPANGIDAQKLVFYGGHSHQKGDLPYLGMQYLSDMQALLEKMKTEDVEYEEVNYNNRLNRNYHYGQAWITVNQHDAENYRIAR